MESPCACRYCGTDSPHLVGQGNGFAAIECRKCGARGPLIDAGRDDYAAQAVAAWNTGKNLGRIAIARVPVGLPAHAMVVAQHIRAHADAIEKGERGAPVGAVLVLREAGTAHAHRINVSHSEAAHVLHAVANDARVRVAAGSLNLSDATKRG